MFISKAYAQEIINDIPDTTILVGEAASSPGNAFAWNMGLIVILVVMFYILLIRPQQKRFAQHKTMLDALEKGDAVVTAGGLVGKIDKILSDEEVLIDLGSMKVTAVRSTIQAKTDKKPAVVAADKEKKPAKKTAKKATKKTADKTEDKT